MVEKSAYLFLGEDFLSKERKVDVIKNELLKGDASVFDLEVLQGKDLDSRQLSESFQRIPALAKGRVVIIKDVDKLNASSRQQLISRLKKPLPKVSLVLETNKFDVRDGFIAQLCQLCRVVNFQKDRPLDVFSLGVAVSRRRPVESLKILSQLLLSGEKPQKILGVLVWQWKKIEADLSRAEFKRGLQMLLETDLNIKRGRLRPDFALELLVAKLSLPRPGNS
jgi:DNA polymerase III delta subunit